ncbi:4'-phosphopantetheinyl transferase superfamily protein [Cupriavidus necator]|uniref:4'-phosphopantetheinyl transferase family protein n=1 Tax=Cupriavidus necator TaxID=106590 RepID=UPI00339D78FC
MSLWQVDLQDPAHIGAREARGTATCLCPAEQAHAASLRQPADRLRFAATRVALRTLLGRCVGCPPASLQFRTGQHGKPFLDVFGAPGFNVSHAGGYAWIAIAGGGGEVGVDIERIDPALGPQAIREMAAHCLTPRELAWLAALHAEAWPGAFFALWTAKEAVLKALGLGIADHLQHVSVVAGAQGEAHRFAAVPEAGQLAGHAAALARTRLYGRQAPAGYAAAMAWLPPA